MPRQAGTINAAYVSIHPSQCNTMNPGIIVTWPGTIIVRERYRRARLSPETAGGRMRRRERTGEQLAQRHAEATNRLLK